MTADISPRQITDLLAQKHSEDVFVTECKNGPTHTGGGHLRMDAWAMKRSWANPCIFAYEIKVARSDFLKDEKWHGYLKYCNQFSFVCPFGLIQPQELPEGVGLIWVSKTGTRLFTKRKAAYRDVDIPESVFRYIIMSRSVIKDSMRGSDKEPESNRDYWRSWLENRKIDREFGNRVSKSMSVAVRKRIHEVEEECREMKKRCERYEAVVEAASQMGIDLNGRFFSHGRAVERLKEASKAIPGWLPRHMLEISTRLAEVGRELERINDRAEA